jgi:hypothetical protein
MRYFVDHIVREIYIIAPAKVNEVAQIMDEVLKANPNCAGYYTFIIAPGQVSTSTNIKTMGEA